jgi:capsule polysaccharide export protein KpsE/RkpR
MSSAQATPVESAAVTKPMSAAEVARQMRHQRARRLARNLAIWVGLPTVLAVVYYGLLARNQYESTATVVLGGANPMHEAVIMREYTLSRAMLRWMDKQHHYSEHFKSNGDFVASLGKKAGSQKRFRYFTDHVRVNYDPASQVLSLEARAFTPEAAQVFTSALLDHSVEFLRANMRNGEDPGLVIVSQPYAPSDSTQPRRVYGIISVFFASLALFGIGSLLIASVREHSQF